ncbi:sterigmatocystin biosynthesis P450 monooxygenase [Trichoderma sp. SZMC 28012]
MFGSLSLIFSAVAGLILLSILISTVKKVSFVLTSPLRALPGPRVSLWTNLVLKRAVVTGTRVHYVHALHQKYGPIVRLSPNEVSVADPQSVQAIHKINSGYTKSPWYVEVAPFGRPILFSMSDSKAHGTRRKLFARAFSKTYLRQNYEKTVHEMTKQVVMKIRNEAKQKGSACVLRWWTFMATDISALLMFGDSFHAIERGQVNEYIRILQSNMKGSGIAAELPWWIPPLLKCIPVEGIRELFRGNDILIKYGLEARRKSKAAGNDRSIFSAVNKEAQTEGGRLDETDVQYESQGLLVAGSDTTAVTMTYLVWAVLSHPQWQAKLEQEVAELRPEFSEEDLEKLPVLNGIIEETLRLYGAAPGGLPRIVPKGGAHMMGHYIPAGTTVTTQAFTLHRDSNLFRNPERFDPSRWQLSDDLEDTGAVSRITDAAKAVYSPFGLGARVCLGVHLARMEMRLATTEFFRACRGARLAHSVTDESMAMENHFLIAPKSHTCEIVLQE